MPEKFDWIQLTTDEWLKGELIAMYEDSLEFDSKKFNDVTFDFGDVRQIRSAKPLQIGLLGGYIAWRFHSLAHISPMRSVDSNPLRAAIVRAQY